MNESERVQEISELVEHLVELKRQYRAETGFPEADIYDCVGLAVRAELAGVPFSKFIRDMHREVISMN